MMHPWYSLFVALSITVCVQGACKLTGVNQCGAEGGNPVPGRLGWEYTYPKKTADYFTQKGMNVFRLPFKWERMIQPTIDSNFSAPDIAAYIDSVNYMTQRAYVIIDPHNYGSGFNGRIGESSTTIQHFVNFWVKMAGVFKQNPRVIYGLMNEPINNDIYTWQRACQAAVTGIRSTGATQTILIPGISYTGAHSWVSSGTAEVLWDIQDPINNYAYEVHQYLDYDSSGQHPECVSETVGVNALTGFTEWARAYNKMGFLGEFDGGSSPTCLKGIDNMITYMDNNTDVWLGWTYWAGGPWWGECWCSLQPNATGTDRAQWASVAPHVNPVLPSSVKVGKTTPPGPVYVAIYKDGLTNGWGDYGWAPHNNKNSSLTHSGSAQSISFTVNSGSNLCYIRSNSLNVTIYTYIQFWVYVTSGSTDGISVSMASRTSDGHVTAVGPYLGLTPLLTTPFSKNTWLQVTVPLATWSSTAVYDGFMISGSGAQSGFLDDIFQVKYVYGSSPTASPKPTSPPPAVICAGPVAENAIVNLTCPANKTISSIDFASYGNSTGSCGAFKQQSCHASNSVSYTQSQCLNKRTCSFMASNIAFSDPCVGVAKYINIQAKC